MKSRDCARVKKGRARAAKVVADVAPLAWIRRTKYRAAALVVAIVLATVATITLAGLPWVPVVGVAVAAACVSVSKLTTRLLKPTCLDCGTDLSSQPVGMQGIICPDCGAVNTPGLVQLAQMGDPQGREGLEKEGVEGEAERAGSKQS